VAPGLTIITANHKYDEVGLRPETPGWGIGIPDDVIVNEDVWIGANVTLCPGVEIGRGCIVAAGSICVKSKIYPPYSIIGGNPAKFIKFRMTLEKQLQQEALFYGEEERIPPLTLERNYKTFN
jgi:acetyltransferase-like isoleucine patch superfamily enzyme